MEGADIQPRTRKSRKSKALTINLKNEPVIIPVDEKIDVEIRDVIRIRPQDFHLIKDSFEEWAKQWE